MSKKLPTSEEEEDSHGKSLLLCLREGGKKKRTHSGFLVSIEEKRREKKKCAANDSADPGKLASPTSREGATLLVHDSSRPLTIFADPKGKKKKRGVNTRSFGVKT